MEDEELKGYKEVGHTTVDGPEVLEGISNSGEVVTVSVNESTKKSGNSANVSEDLLHIYTAQGISITEENGKHFMTFPDGTKSEIDEETSKKMAENGIGNADFMKVTAVRETTEYEKAVAKEKKNVLNKLLPLLLAAAILIPIAFKGCGDTRGNKPDVIGPEQTPIVDVEQINQEELLQAITTMYGCSYDTIMDCLDDPATIVRVAQDAYLSADFDMEEYLRGDLCKYSVIQQGVVNPGAEFVSRVNEFKEKYSQVTEFDEATYKQMMEEARPLLSEQGQWIDTAVSLVVMHAQTTQATMDAGKRVEDYSSEIKVVNGQQVELTQKREKLNFLVESLDLIEEKIAGISNGTIKFAVLPNGVITLDENSVFMRSSSSLSKTMSEDVSKTNDGSSGFSK